MGAGEELFRSVVIMNMNWKYKFSWTIYMSELFISSPVLVVCGFFSILANFADSRKRAYSFGLLFLLFGAFLQVYLMPVPYRQSFLPLLLILALGSANFFSNLLIFFTRIKLKILQTVLPVLLLFSSAYSLIENLKFDNSKDVNFYLSIAGFRDDLSFFDGRALVFYREPVSYYGWLHFELLQMLDHEDFTKKTIRALKNNFLPPIIYDYRVKLMTDDIQTFVAENYLASEIDKLMLPGKIIKRILPASKTFFSIPFSGKWQISWNGSASLNLNEKKISNGSVVFLPKGEHCISADNFAWDCKICAYLKKE